MLLAQTYGHVQISCRVKRSSRSTLGNLFLLYHLDLHILAHGLV